MSISYSFAALRYFSRLDSIVANTEYTGFDSVLNILVGEEGQLTFFSGQWIPAFYGAGQAELFNNEWAFPLHSQGT